MNVARLKILMTKERKQLLRDPYSILIGILLPIVLLFCFGYAMSMDIRNIKLAIVAPQSSREANAVIARFSASEYFETTRVFSTAEGRERVRTLKADACLYLPRDLSRQVAAGQVSFLVVVNATNATSAQLMDTYIKGVLAAALAAQAPPGLASGARIESRMWYNEANDSRYYMIPGMIVIIMSIIGTFLTSLVMAREYEHGNLESMFVTPMTSTEILIAKAVNNFILGFLGLIISLLAAYFLFGVPIRGSLAILLLGSSLYLLVSLSLGLLISSIAKNQFIASQMAMFLTFLPSLLLSGFLYEINNMPVAIQWLTRAIPARYYMELMQSLFLAGDVRPIIVRNLAALLGFTILFILLAKLKNPKNLET